MNKIILTILLVVVSAMAFADYPIQTPKERCDANTFSIMPWGGMYPTGRLFDKEAMFQDVYDMGFNCSGFIPCEDVNLSLKYNLAPVVEEFPASPDGDPIAWANKYKEKLGKNADKVFQVYIKDEPFIKDAKWVSGYANACKNILNARPYINMNPNYCDAKTLGGTYTEYLDKFLTGCPVDYVSYDNYSLFAGDYFDEDRFYSNIEEIRNAAIKHNINFVNIILSVGHFNYADPSDYNIHVQGWSTLAYGGKGLSYFLITTPPIGAYRTAAYDRNCHRTPAWTYIQNMNYTIHNLMPYYKNLKSVNVYHIGDRVPKGCKGVESSKLMEEVEIGYGGMYRDPAAAYMSALVGEFVDQDGTPYIILVNKNPKNAMCIGKVKFKGYDNVNIIRDGNYDGVECNFGGEHKWLAPGHGFLLKAVK